jgi:hypothetical protein
VASVAELEKLRGEVAEVNSRIASVTGDLTPAQMMWKPRAQAWSMAENLVHLRLTVDMVLPAVDKAITDAGAHGWFSGGPFELGLMGRFFVWYVEPPPVMRLPAPKKLAALPTRSPAEAMAEFLEGQSLMLDRMARARGLDLVRARFKSPFAGFVRMNLLALFAVFTGHERRHAWQMENRRRELGL